MNVFPPKFECLSAFLHELVPLIDRGHAGDCSDLVVEDLVRNVRRHTQRRHAGNHGPAKIVKRPAGHARALVQFSLRLRVPLKKCLAID